MKKEEFLAQLERLLMDIPVSDRLDAISYYRDYFDEAGVENEQDVIRELGSPEKVAKTIIEDLKASEDTFSRDYSSPEDENRAEYQSQGEEQKQWNGQTQQKQEDYPKSEKKRPWALIIIILILTFPLWVGVVGGLFGALVGLMGGLIGLVAGLFGSGVGIIVGGVIAFIAGFFRLAVSPLEGIITIGIGAILLAVGLLILLLFAWLTFKWIPALFWAIYKGCKGLFHRNEGGNEI